MKIFNINYNMTSRVGSVQSNGNILSKGDSGVNKIVVSFDEPQTSACYMVVKRYDGATTNNLYMTPDFANQNYYIVFQEWMTGVAGDLEITVKLVGDTEQTFGKVYLEVYDSLTESDETITDAQYQELLQSLNDHIGNTNNPHVTNADNAEYESGVSIKQKIDSDKQVLDEIDLRVTDLEQDAILKDGSVAMEDDLDLGGNSLVNVNEIKVDTISSNGGSYIEVINDINVSGNDIGNVANIETNSAYTQRLKVDIIENYNSPFIEVSDDIDMNGKGIYGVGEVEGEIGTFNNSLTKGGKEVATEEYVDQEVARTLKPMGNWDASTNTPTLLATDINRANQVWYVNVAGTQFGIEFEVGDELVYNINGEVFRRDNVDAVISVQGKSGAVQLNADDIPFNGSGTNYLVSKTDVESAVKELDTQVKGTNETTAKLAVSNVFTQPQQVPNATLPQHTTNLNQVETMFEMFKQQFRGYNLASPDLTGKEYLGDGWYRYNTGQGITKDYNVFSGHIRLNGTNTVGQTNLYLFSNLLPAETVVSFTYEYVSGTVDVGTQYITLFPNTTNEPNGLTLKTNDTYLDKGVKENYLSDFGSQSPRIYFGNGQTTFNDFTFKIQLEKGSTATPYTVPVQIPQYKIVGEDLKANEIVYDDDKNVEEAIYERTNMVNVTYQELKDLRDNEELVSGTFYRITDYETTTTQVETRSAGNLFDVIVQALDEKTLSENAGAIQSERDVSGYFNGVDLGSWKLKYRLDNDNELYYWADTINGKGVIYQMIDEFGNDLPYDFKNIQFKRYKITAFSTNTDFVNRYYALKDLDSNTVPSGATIDDNDFIWAYTFTVIDENGIVNDVSLNKNKTFVSDEGIYYHTKNNKIGSFDYDYYDEIEETSKIKEALGNNVILYDYDYYGYWEFYGFYYNTIGNDFNRNTIGNDFNRNTIGNYFYSNTIGNSFYSNTIGNYFYSNTIGNYFYSNTIGNDFYYNTIGNNFNRNTVGNNIRFIQFSGDQIRNLYIKSGLTGASSANKLDLYYSELQNRTYPTTIEQIANGNIVSIHQETPLAWDGKKKITNTSSTWEDI